MADLYSNENFPRPAVLKLRECGHDVVTFHEAHPPSRVVPDEEVLRYATEDGRAVVTLNRRDFINLHSEISSHAGIIVCTVDRNHEALARRIDYQIRQHNELTGRLIRITRDSPESPAP